MKTLGRFVVAIAVIVFAAIASASAQVMPTPRPDTRAVIELPAAEYEHVMHEMRLPPAFRQLAFDTHARFDQIAVEAGKGDRTLVLTRVSELLGNCVACHSSFAMRLK